MKRIYQATMKCVAGDVPYHSNQKIFKFVSQSQILFYNHAFILFGVTSKLDLNLLLFSTSTRLLYFKIPLLTIPMVVLYYS